LQPRPVASSDIVIISWSSSAPQLSQSSAHARSRPTNQEAGSPVTTPPRDAIVFFAHLLKWTAAVERGLAALAVVIVVYKYIGRAS